MNAISMTEARRNELRRIAYNHYLRTGRVPIEIKSVLGEDIAGGYWVKFNPYHDPDNGRFTFAPDIPMRSAMLSSPVGALYGRQVLSRNAQP